MMVNLAKHNLFGKALSFCLENIIDPSRTLPIQIAEEYECTPPEDRIPRIFMVEQDYFVQGLRKYLTSLSQEDTEGRGHLVVIATDDSKITEMVKEDSALLAHLTYYPLLSCKGLEFMGCAIFGLPTKGGAYLELDVLGQYYTVCTRSRLKMILFVDRQQFDYLRNAGWEKITPEIASIFDLCRDFPDRQPDEIIAEFLSRIGTVDLAPEAMRTAGEAYLLRFRETLHEPFLRESITYYENGGWDQEAVDTRKQGAQAFEQGGLYERALHWYLQINEPVSAVRCCKACIDKLRISDGERVKSEIERLVGIAHNQTKQLEGQDSFSEASICWETLEEFDKAILCGIQANDLERAERLTDKVVEEDKRMELIKQIIAKYIELAEYKDGVMVIDSAKLKRAEHLVEKLSQGERITYYRSIANRYLQGNEGQWPDAYRVLRSAGLSREAEDLANRWEREGWYRILVNGYMAVNDVEQVNLLGNRLKRNREFEAAAYCFRTLKNFNEAANCWMKAYDYWRDQAHGVLGIRVDELPTRWFMKGFRRWLGHIGNRCSHYGMKVETLEQIMKLIPPSGPLGGLSEEQERVLVEQVKAMRKQLLSSREWRKDIQDLIADLERRMEKYELQDQNTTGIFRQVRDTVARELDPARLEDIRRWVLDNLVDWFKRRAESTVEEVLATNDVDRHIKASYGWYKICANKRRALAYIDHLWQREQEELKLIAVRCWREIGEQFIARERIDALDPLKWAHLAFKAYEILYSDDRLARDEAKSQLKQKLEQEGSNESKKILADLFTSPHVVTGPTSQHFDTQALAESIVQLQEAINRLQLEDADDTTKIQQDLEYIKKKVEKNELSKAKEQWSVTRQIVMRSSGNLAELVNAMDELFPSWEDLRVETS